MDAAQNLIRFADDGRADSCQSIPLCTHAGGRMHAGGRDLEATQWMVGRREGTRAPGGLSASVI